MKEAFFEFLEKEKDKLSFNGGVFLSFILHFILFIVAFIALERTNNKAAQASQVFTVTLEGGKKLGGISQVPKKGKEKLKVGAQKSKVETKAKKKKVAEKTKEAKKKLAKKELEFKKKQEKKLAQKKAAKKKAEKKKAAEKKALEKKKKLEAKKKAEKKKELAKKAAEKKALEKKKKLEEKKKADTKKTELKKKLEEAKKRKAQREQARKKRDQRLAEIAKKVRSNVYNGESANAGGEGFGAAKLGGEGFGGGTLASAEKVAYANALQQHVKSGWRWLAARQKLRCLVLVDILPDGRIRTAKISQSSGNSNFDESVLRAVKKANPVPAAPVSIYNDFRQVRFWFDSSESS